VVRSDNEVELTLRPMQELYLKHGICVEAAVWAHHNEMEG